MLFENSIVCLVVLFLLLFFGHAFCISRVWGVVVFLMPVFWCLFVRSDFSDSDSPTICGGFCLESLILAQDERWRRA